MALEMAGNKAVSWKLERSVTKIDAQIPCLSKWSFLPFRYPKLRSLTINRNKGLDYHPFYAPNDQFIPNEGHKTLESLSIHSTHSLTLLHGYALPSKLSRLLPSLKKLEIESNSHFSSNMLRNVPPTITDFRLTLSADLSDTPFHISALGSLPQSLRTLHITSDSLVECTPMYGPANTISLPPTLTDLSLRIQRSSLRVLKSLPPKMRSLIHTGTIEARSEIKLSELPKGLTVLHCNCLYRNGTLILDSPFPDTLISLIMNLNVRIESQEERLDELRSFPPSLTALEFFHPLLHQMALSSSLSALLTVHISTNLGDFNNMRNLTSVTFDEWLSCDGMISSLPETLTHLTATPTRALEWLTTIPKLTHLKSLHLYQSDPMPHSYFWEHLYSRLESLHCYVAHFDYVDDLSGEWSNLKELTLETAELLPELSLWCTKEPSDRGPSPIKYSSTLEKLTIFGLQFLPLFWTPIAQLPRIESLSLYGHNEPIRRPYNAFLAATVEETIANLPASLTALVITLPYYIPPNCIQMLPTGLKHLEFISEGYGAEFYFIPNADPSALAVLSGVVTHIKYSELWTAEHLKSLPPRLETINLSVNRMFDPNLNSHLWMPPNLIISPFTIQISTKASVESHRQLAL